MREDGIDTRNSDFGAGLLLDVGDLAVVNNDGVTGGSDTETTVSEVERLANGLGKGSVTVGSKDLEERKITQVNSYSRCLKSEKTTHQLLVSAESLAPGSLHKWVIGRENDDLVGTLGLEIAELLYKRWNVVSSAGGGEGAGDRHNDDLLGGKLLFSVVDNGNAAGYRTNELDGNGVREA